MNEHQKRIFHARRYAAALALIREIDTCRLLASCGRLTHHDSLAMSEAVSNYNMYKERKVNASTHRTKVTQGDHHHDVRFHAR